MDDKLKQEVYDLINKAQAEMNAGNLNSANASMDAVMIAAVVADNNV